VYSPSSISVVLTKACSEEELTMKPASNYTVVTDRARGERPIFALSLLFFSNTDSPFYVITIAAIFTVQLSGSGTAVMCMTLPDLADEELDL